MGSGVANNDLVSVIIPTYKRPELLRRALVSVLQQTHTDLECIIVDDNAGGDGAVRLAESFNDPRVRVIVHPVNKGANAARNTGILEARGRWIAVLDDDDEWLPEKLARQVARARASRFARPIVPCQAICRMPHGDTLMPSRAPAEGEHISDYMCLRKGLFHWSGLLQTSVLFADGDLFRRHLFDPTSAHVDENVWLLNAASDPEAGLDLLMEPLSIWYCDNARPRRSTTELRPYELLCWVRDNRELFTPRAYAALLLTFNADMARRAGQLNLLPALLCEACAHGRPRVRELVLFFGVLLIPTGLRRWLRNSLAALRHK